MGRRQWALHALGIAACFLAVSRPDLLWSSVPPRLPPEEAGHLLAPLAAPTTVSLDDQIADVLNERIWELRGFRRARGQVAEGETLEGVLRANGVAAAEALTFSRALKPVFDPRRVRPGDEYGFLLDPAGGIARFSYRRSPVERYRAEAVGHGWRVERLEVPIAREEQTLVGRVAGSLYGSFLDGGGDADLVMAFADLFAWDVDFSRETREGDEFRLIYERLTAEGAPVGNGRILAAQYRGERGIYTAVYYHSGKTEGYFDPEGKSVRKSFLRSPLKFTRISSRFTMARRHPVLDVVRPHRGIDYAAPTGTPVWSVADGKVEYAGWRGDAGRTVVIRHARGYETAYNHLSGFGKGVRVGARVDQGQVIGYVGATGLATGPHLDFRVKKDGRWVDPLRERYVAGDPVPRAEREAYRAWALRWLERIDGLEPAPQVALEVGN